MAAATVPEEALVAVAAVVALASQVEVAVCAADMLRRQHTSSGYIQPCRQRTSPHTWRVLEMGAGVQPRGFATCSPDPI